MGGHRHAVQLSDAEWSEFCQLVQLLPSPPSTLPLGVSVDGVRKAPRKSKSRDGRERSVTASVLAVPALNMKASSSQSNLVCISPRGDDISPSSSSSSSSSPPPSPTVVAVATTSSPAASSSSAEQRRAQLRRTATRANLQLQDGSLVAACLGSLPSDQLQKVYWALIDLACASEAELKSKLERAYAAVLEQRRGQARDGGKRGGLSKIFAKAETLPSLSFDKARLSFGLGANDECPLQTAVKDRVRLTCLAGRLRFSWRRPKIHKSHCIAVDPVEGVLKKGQSVDCLFTLTVNTTFVLEEVIVLDVDEFGHLFFVVNLVSEKSVFGVDPSELPAVHDLGCHVPAVLQTLRHYLVKADGLRSEGVFRLAPDEAETLAVKASLNKNESLDYCQDVNAIANLIKVWFRELPTQLLNVLSPDTFNAVDEHSCQDVADQLPEPNRSLLRWLLRLMADTARQEPHNKMGPRNLAIVIAPNLFNAAELPPLESLNLSQNVVNFIKLLLEAEIRSQAEQQA